jgi:hypothetical protein
MLLVVVVAVTFNCWKHQDWIPAWLLVGGLLGVCLEPVMDVVGLVWYPPQGNWAVLHMHGVSVPVLCVAGYVWLYGGLGGLSYILLRNGASRIDLFRAFVALVILLMAIEFAGSGTGVYHYYGDQPLRIFDYVAYQGFVNAAIPIIIGFTAHLLQPHVTKWRAVLVIPVVPFAIGRSILRRRLPGVPCRQQPSAAVGGHTTGRDPYVSALHRVGLDDEPRHSARATYIGRRRGCQSRGRLGATATLSNRRESDDRVVFVCRNRANGLPPSDANHGLLRYADCTVKLPRGQGTSNATM